MRKQNSYYPRKDDTTSSWYVVDAENKVLGRLASEVATVLRGKNEATFTPSVDPSNFVVVINADKVAVTGRKREDKKYYRHSGYLGGLKTTTFSEMMEKDPRKVITLAIKGMLPKNKLGRRLITKLKVYTGAEHPHSAQQPVAFNVSKG